MRPLILALAVLGVGSTALAQEAEEDTGGGAPEGSATASPSSRGDEAPNASHTVERGDTLWDLSRKYLGSPWYWPKVWSYNPDIANPHWIYPGNMVRFFGADEQPTQVEVGTEVPDIEEGSMVDDGEGVTKSGQIGVRQKDSVTVPLTSFVTTKELETSARIVGSFSEAEMITAPYTVYVDISGKKSLKVGDSTVVYRPDGEVIHPKTHAFFGYMTSVVAEGKVVAVDTKKNIATMTITNSINELQRGDSVSPAGESVVRTVAPRANDKEIKGAVLMTSAQRFVLLQSEGFLVLMDKGADDGVKVGNTFTFYRSGDTSGIERHFFPQENDPKFPKESVGVCMAVDVKSKASSCLLLRTMRELVAGDEADVLTSVARTAAR